MDGEKLRIKVLKGRLRQEVLAGTVRMHSRNTLLTLPDFVPNRTRCSERASAHLRYYHFQSFAIEFRFYFAANSPFAELY